MGQKERNQNSNKKKRLESEYLFHYLGPLKIRQNNVHFENFDFNSVKRFELSN